MCAQGMRLTRRKLIALALAVTATSASVAQSGIAEASRRHSLEIDGGAAPVTLREFVRQTGMQVLFEFDAIRNHTTHPISGRFDPSEALALMLADSGLGFEFVNERTISVRPSSLIKTSEGPRR